MDENRFSALKEQYRNGHIRCGIGTYKERTQHLLLKNYFEPNPDLHEVPVGKYIADIYNSDGICEIQTSGFGRLLSKLEVFLDSENVCVVYPCTSVKRILWSDTEMGEVNEGVYRAYPKAKYRLLCEMLYISSLFPSERLTVRLCELRVSEVRLLDGYGSDRKRRATKTDTVPDEILKITDIRSTEDIRALLPFDGDEILTAEKISKALGLSRRNLWSAVKFLTTAGILVRIGKDGRIIQYRLR